jgi:hypothetical protein
VHALGLAHHHQDYVSYDEVQVEDWLDQQFGFGCAALMAQNQDFRAPPKWEEGGFQSAMADYECNQLPSADS